MADDRNDGDRTEQERSDKQGQQQSMDSQGAEGSFGGQSSGGQSTSAQSTSGGMSGSSATAAQNPGGGMSGQPIGGNDSNTGSGTTLTSGYTPPTSQNGAAQSQPQVEGASAHMGDAAATKTMDKADHSMAEKSWDKDRNSTGSSAGQQASRDSEGGFVGSQANDSGDYVQKGDQTRSEDRNSDRSGDGSQ